MGKFITPLGIFNPIQFRPLINPINKPHFLREGQEGGIFPISLSGVQFHGRLFPRGSDKLEYSIFSGMYEEGATDSVHTGARLGYTFGNTGVTLGTNFMHGRVNRTIRVDPWKTSCTGKCKR